MNKKKSNNKETNKQTNEPKTDTISTNQMQNSLVVYRSVWSVEF